MKRFLKDNYLLFIILYLAIFLRVYNIPQTLLFHFDQGYHGLAIMDIWNNKHFPLLGHKTDVDGVFHGSFFYFLMLPLYFVSSWNPAGVSMILAALDGLAVIFIYLIGKNTFNKNVGLLAALFYAVSYSLISYSRWLSNVTLIPFFSTIFFYFLVKSYQGKISFFPLALFFAGIIAQLNGAIGFFFLPIVILVGFVSKKKLFAKPKILVISLITFILPSLPLVLFDIRHNFLVTKSIWSLFFKEHTSSFNLLGLFLSLQKVEGEFVNLLTANFPVIALIILLLILTAILASWRNKEKQFMKVKMLILFFLVPIAGFLIYPGGIHQFFFIGTLPILTLTMAWAINYWYSKSFLKSAMIVLVISLVLLNLYNWTNFLKPGFNLIPIGTRNLITLEDRLMAADFMYRHADGQPFQTAIYIIPYNQEQPWDYVFSWHGKSKYGFVPNKNEGKTFVIYEPDYDYPYRLNAWLDRIEKDHGKVISSFKAHDLTVEEREK